MTRTTHHTWFTRMRHELRLALITTLAATAALVVACGSSGNSASSLTDAGVTASTCSNCGAAVISLSDAPGDFLSYIVNVTSLQLKRADGTVVETLPTTTQVDFSQLVNLSEILSARQVPAGNYVGASITLDYSGATLVVDNGTTGVTIPAAQIINGATSLPLAAPNPTQITLTLTLGANQPLVVTANTIANLALDFNLLVSDRVTPSATNPTTVTVNPVLTASLVPDATKDIRVRGSLVSVGAGSYVVNLRPFNDGDDGAGQLTVNTTDTTNYTINGTSAAGAAGLTQLGSLPAGTVTAAYGIWDRTSQTFTAQTVMAGSSVVGTGQDSVEGTVLSRSADMLTLADSRTWRHAHAGMGYAHQVIATVGTATTVTEDGQANPLSIADISVGQHLQLSGTLATDASGNATLDATAGSARLMATTALGIVNAVGSGSVTLALDALDGRPASAFTFAGTGTSTAADASATAYIVAVPAALSTASLTLGAPVKFAGFVAPFNQAPPDFAATAVTNYAQTRALLDIRWTRPGTATPFATLSSSALAISQATLQSSVEHFIRIGPERLDASTLATGVQLAADTAASNPQFALAHAASRTIASYGAFGDFATALTSALNGSVAALQVEAYGPFNVTTGALAADQLIVILND
jgi:hypothetical protein